MYKKELLKIPPCELSAKQTGRKKDKNLLIATAKVVQTQRSGKILVVDYYDTKSRELQVRFFVDKNNGTHLAVTVDDTKWFTGSIARKLEGFYSPQTLTVYDDMNTKETVSEYLDINDENYTHRYYYYEFGYRIPDVSGATAIIETWLSNKREKATLKAHQRRADKNQLYHSFFKQGYSFMREAKEYFLGCFKESYIFFGNLTKKGKRFGVCSHCGHRFELQRSRPKKDDVIACPKCLIQGKCRDKRYAECISDKKMVAVADRKNEYVTFEILECCRSFCNTLKPTLSFESKYRTVYNIKTGSCQSSSIQSVYWPWTQFKTWAPGRHNFIMYPGNLNQVIGDLVPYLNMNEICKTQNSTEKPINIIQLFLNYRKYPCVEYLYKMGFTKLVALEDIEKYICVHGYNASDVLSVPKQYIPWMSKFCVNSCELKFLQNLDLEITQEDFYRFRNMSLIGYVDTINDLLQKVSLKKLFNYVSKQHVLCGMEFSYILTCWRDYISMSQEIDVNINKKNIMPANVIESHNVLLKRYNSIKKEIENRKSIEALELVNKHFKCYERNGYCIKVPKKRSDFITEGQELSHCVGTDRYYNNHVKGKSMIFFIRKLEKPKVAQYTAEIDMSSFTVIQCYGYGDSIPPKNVKEFINEFAKYLKTHKNKEVNVRAKDIQPKKAIA